MILNYFFNKRSRLFKSELRDEMAKAKKRVFALVLGCTLSFVGFLLLCFGLVHLLQFSFPILNTWQCFGIVGVLTFVGGLGVLQSIRGSSKTVAAESPKRAVQKSNEMINGQHTSA